MGSGKVIRSAIEKYGIENFTKVILEIFDNSTDMYAREKEIVNEDFLSLDNVYNLRRGGHGGFDFINSNQLYGFSDSTVAKKGRDAANTALYEKYGPEWRTIISKMGRTPAALQKSKLTRDANIAAGITQAPSTIHMNTPTAIEKKKKKFKQIKHQQGRNNSQFGKMWITNGSENRSVFKTSSIPPGWRPGRILKSI